MNRTTLILPLLPIACATQKSKVATQFGYRKSTMVQAGPYQLHYAKDGTNEFLLLSKGDCCNLLSRIGNEGTDIYVNGCGFIHFQQRPDGSLTNLHVAVPDAHGNENITWIDRDGDGQWDIKIDDVQKKASTWKDGQWVDYPSWAEATNAPAPISH